MDVRHVRLLRLRAATAGGARRAQILVEDALRTATVPGAGEGRLVLMRRLDLGTIRTGQSPASLALRIEQRLAASPQITTLLHAGDPGAAAQSAVYFRDEVEALVLLVQRIACGRSALEWFWPLAVPGFRTGQAGPSLLRTLVLAALQAPEGPLRVAALLADLLEADALDPLLDALRPDDGSALVSTWGSAAAAEGIRTERRTGPRLPAGRWEPLLARWAQRWGPGDARSTWLAACALVAERPARLLDAGLLRHAQALAVSVAAPAGPGTPNQVASAPLSRSGRRPPGSRAVRPPSGVSAPCADLLPETARVPFARGRASGMAGLYFLLAALAHLGLQEQVAAHPTLTEIDLVARLLRRCAAAAGALEDDPVLDLLASEEPGPPPAYPLPFVAPAAWWGSVCRGPYRLHRQDRRRSALYDRSGRLMLALWNGPMPAEVRGRLPAGSHPARLSPSLRDDGKGDLERVLGAWLEATRRWVRLYAGLSLQGVVRRGGTVAATRTHVDLYFGLRQADVRIRRAGLDLDPGWVPSLGKVVQFHYE